MDRFQRVGMALALCGATAWLAALAPGTALGQAINAKAANIGAPKDIGTLEAHEADMRAMRLPNAAAVLNRKQQLLRERHLPAPIGPLPPGLQPMAAPRAETAATVSTALTPAADSGVRLLVNRRLTDPETNNDTSTVCEPSLAVRGREILLTGNWFAVFSKNSGATFEYRNPATTFPASTQGEFCCDQVALYDRANDLMVWLLQYINNAEGNTLRVAVARGDDIRNERWRYYDFTPQNVGNWPNEWFDFPDLVLSNTFLYVSSNVFSTTTDTFKRSVLLRLPLDRLAAYQGFTYQYFDTNEVGSLRATHGAQDTVYFAAHLNQATVRVFTWPESSTQIQKDDTTVGGWSNATRVAPGPDGRDWLGRADGRITAAWLSGNTIGFAWTAAQDNQFRYPHVRVAVLDRSTKMVLGQPHIWNPEIAFAYPAAAPNVDGRLGIGLAYGGGTQYPGHAVGVQAADGSKWELVSTASGRYGPADNRWGDYVAVRPHGANPRMWVATGYTLQTGSLRTDVEVRYIRFQLSGN